MRRGEKARRRLLGLLLLGLALCLAMPLTVRAEDGDTTDVVADMAELQAWLDENPKGGTITLGAGIEITEPVRLYLCRVEAESTLVLPAFVTLDTCIVSSLVSGGTVISRKISRVTKLSAFLFAVGGQTTGYFDNNSVFCTLTLSADGAEDVDERAYILFNDSRVDYNKPGEYLLPGVLESPYDDLYDFDIVTEACPIAITITVYDPAIPYFYSYKNARGTLAVSYYYSGDAGALTLWRSDDGGASWQVYWQPNDEAGGSFYVDIGADSLDLFFGSAELAAPALFVFEVGQGVGSDILYVDLGAEKSVGRGGDRDSGDRIWLPWEFFTGKPGNGKTKPGQNHGWARPVQDNSDDDDGERYEGNITPATQPAPQQPAKSALIDLPAIFTPATALAITDTAPLNPPLAEEPAPLESPSENQPPQSASAPEPEPEPQPASEPEPEPEPAPQPEPEPQPAPEPEPEPQPATPPQVIPSPAASPAPIFPAWAAGLIGAGGVGGVGYALHKRRRGK